MSKKKRAALIGTTLIAAACGRSPAPQRVEPAEIDASTPDSAARDAEADARNGLFSRAIALLAPDAQTNSAPPPRTVYTWTTADQIAVLRKNPRLLTREESPTKGAAYLDQVIDALAKRSDPIAKVLYTSTFAKMRYAWRAPWATREGWPGETYGDELIAVTLKPDAIILSLNTATGTWSAQDLDGRAIALADVPALRARIAAIAFESESGKAAPNIAPAPVPTTTYREIALCNESMIESWAVGTPQIAKVLDDDAAAMDAFAAYLRAFPAPTTTSSLAEAWAATPAQTPEALYRSALAFDNALYALDADAVSAIATHLRAAPRGVALQTTPTLTFPGPGTPRGVPTVKRVPRGTFSTFGRQP